MLEAELYEEGKIKIIMIVFSVLVLKIILSFIVRHMQLYEKLCQSEARN